MSVPTLAEKVAHAMKRTQAEEADIKTILESPDKTVQYLVEIFWKKYVVRKLMQFARSNCYATTLTFKPWIEMQKTMRKDKVYEAVRYHNFPLDQISKALVDRAIAEGFDAYTYDEMHHPEGEGSPYPETFIEISLPERPEFDQRNENLTT